MKKTVLFLFIAITGLTVAGCKKTEFKETVTTGIAFKALSMEITWGANYLTIDSLYVEIGNFTLAGDHLQAEDIYLTNPTVVNGYFTGTDTQFNVSFDIPQGTYESMQFTMKFNGNAALRMRGTYHQSNGMTKRVIMDVNSDEFIVKSIQQTGSGTVLVDKNNPGKINILLDPDELFSGLNPGIWNAATPSVVGGQDAIQVSNANNGNIHNLVKDKINTSLSYNFE